MPSPSVAAILAVLETFSQPAAPRGYEQEPRDVYEARLEVMAEATALEAHSVEEAATEIVIWVGESQLDPWVHAGLVHPIWTQDHGAAHCLGQLHRSGLVPNADELAGTDLDATRRCAAATLRVIRSSAWSCTHGSLLTRDDVERAVAAYAKGIGCTPTRQSIQRARQWETIRARLYVAQGAGR